MRFDRSYNPDGFICLKGLRYLPEWAAYRAQTRVLNVASAVVWFVVVVGLWILMARAF